MLSIYWAGDSEIFFYPRKLATASLAGDMNSLLSARSPYSCSSKILGTTSTLGVVTPLCFDEAATNFVYDLLLIASEPLLAGTLSDLRFFGKGEASESGRNSVSFIS